MRRFAIVLATAGIALVATASSAWAHVTVSPDEAAKGSFATLTFQVPSEEADANTTKVVVHFPSDPPIASARVEPVAGWTAEVTKKALTPPVTNDEGETIDEVVDTVSWTAADGGGLDPSEFQQFKVSTRLPDEGETVVFTASQTYSNGETVEWNEATPPGGEEPEHPRPEVTLTEGSGEGDGHGGETPTTVAESGGSGDAAKTAISAEAISTAQDDADSAKTVATIGVIAGIIGLIVAIIAIVMARKKPSTT